MSLTTPVALAPELMKQRNSPESLVVTGLMRRKPGRPGLVVMLENVEIYSFNHPIPDGYQELSYNLVLF